MLFHVKKQVPCYRRKRASAISYYYALDGRDVKNGFVTVVVFAKTAEEASAHMFFQQWKNLPEGLRPLFTQLIQLYSTETACHALQAYGAGHSKDVGFLNLLDEASRGYRHSFQQQMKSYLKVTPKHS